MKHLFKATSEHVGIKTKNRCVKRFNKPAMALVPVLALLFTFLLSGMAYATSGITATATPSNSTPTVGDTITVAINMTIDSDVALGSFDCIINWDPDVLTYIGNSEVPNGFFGAVNAGNAGNGKIIFNRVNTNGVTGNIVVMTITFKVTGAGTTVLSLNYTSMAAAYSFKDLLPDLTINNSSVTAVQSHTVTFDANGGTGTMNQQTGTAATALTANAFTKTGYTFTGWNTAANGSGAAYNDNGAYSFAEDITLYAQWTLNTYTISWDTDGDGDIDDTTTVAHETVPSHADGSKATDVQYSYSFDGWSPALSPATGPATYTASFSTTVNKYTITFNSNGGSAVDQITEDYDTAIDAAPVSTLTWYTLEGWYTEESLTNKAVFPYQITGNATLYAKWVVNGLLGDVNNDGVVNSTDALVILSYSAQITVPDFPESIGDINKDGVINSDDALIILSYTVGLEVSYRVGEAV